MPIKRRFVAVDFEMSYEEIKKGWKMPYSHYHSQYEIYILLSGERTVSIGDNTYAVSEGYATLFPQNVAHHSMGNTDFSGICIHFSIDLLNRYLKANAVKSLMRLFETPVIYLPKEYCQQLLVMTKNFQRKDSENYLLLAKLLYDISAYQNPKDYKQPQVFAENNFMQNAIMEYIHNNFTVISTVSEISNVLSVSESYIYQVVKASANMTPKQYINYLRIRHAKRELEYSNRSLPVIQEVCGFHNFSYFLRVFKAQTGMTPTEYRNSFIAK